MTEILRFIASLCRSTTSFNLGNYTNANNDDRTSPHLDSQVELPKTRWTKVRQTIQIHVPCHNQDLIKLWIYVPKNFEYQTAEIQITDRNYAQPPLHKLTISTLISSQYRWLDINFSRSIPPDTKLRIDFDSLYRNGLARSSEYFAYGISLNRQYSFLGRGYFHLSDRSSWRAKYADAIAWIFRSKF